MYDPEYIAYKQKAALRYGLGVHQSHFVERRVAVLLLVAFVIGVVVGLALFAPADARAECAPEDVEGSWKTYATAGVLGFQHCGLIVLPDGTVLGPAAPGDGTRCMNAEGVRSEITGGRLFVEPMCRVSGFVDNSFGRFDIYHGWMNLDATRITLVGRDSDGIPQMVIVERRPDWVGPRALVDQLRK